MKANGITIDDTFAEAFGMSATGVIVTADSPKWARQAAVTMSGFGTLHDEIIGGAKRVAEAAGGILGFGNRISREEQAVIDELERAFDAS